jgi:hypothetical protein
VQHRRDAVTIAPIKFPARSIEPGAIFLHFNMHAWNAIVKFGSCRRLCDIFVILVDGRSRHLLQEKEHGAWENRRLTQTSPAIPA